MKRIHPFLIAFFVFSISVNAQTVMSVDADIEDFDLVVTYNVAGLGSGQLFDVQLYSSKDNFGQPLSGDNIQGVVGYGIVIESTNKIVVKNPLDVLEGISNVNFKVKLEMVYNPVTLREPAGVSFVQKKKKPMKVVWRGGLKSESVKFDLYRYDELVKNDFYLTRNSGSAEFKMPNVDKGAGYIMKMEFNSMDSPIELPPLTVKPKKSAAARIFNIALLLVVVDAGLYFGADTGFLFKSILGEETIPTVLPPTTTTDDPLPDAPDAPGRAKGLAFTIPFFN